MSNMSNMSNISDNDEIYENNAYLIYYIIGLNIFYYIMYN